MIILRAEIITSVDINSGTYSGVTVAEDAIATIVRDALAEVGNVRTGVHVKLGLASVPTL